MFHKKLLFKPKTEIPFPAFPAPTESQSCNLGPMADPVGTIGGTSAYGYLCSLYSTADVSMTIGGTQMNLSSMTFVPSEPMKPSTTFGFTVDSGYYPGIYLQDWEWDTIKGIYLYDQDGNLLDTKYCLAGFYSETQYVFLYCAETYPTTINFWILCKTQEELTAEASVAV